MTGFGKVAIPDMPEQGFWSGLFSNEPPAWQRGLQEVINKAKEEALGRNYGWDEGTVSTTPGHSVGAPPGGSQNSKGISIDDTHSEGEGVGEGPGGPGGDDGDSTGGAGEGEGSGSEGGDDTA